MEESKKATEQEARCQGNKKTINQEQPGKQASRLEEHGRKQDKKSINACHQRDNKAGTKSTTMQALNKTFQQASALQNAGDE